ncbi:response regulator transcription factor [Streptomyces sp. NPDC127033]|uniref:response regulator transcription factor n=1 Tax=Streptomyces sp. NPDC127033 TaxID=3347110 RepID=UPI00365E9112
MDVVEVYEDVVGLAERGRVLHGVGPSGADVPGDTLRVQPRAHRLGGLAHVEDVVVPGGPCPGMPPTHTDEGIVAAVEARRRRPDLAVLVLSAYVEQSFATELLGGGVNGLGYLLKERVGRVEEFLDALRRVAGGGTAIDPDVVAQLFTRSRQDTRLERLSPRERDVLALMAEGLGNSAIAGKLVVTDGAVHKHIRSIFAKLDLSPTDQVDRRVAAVLRYLEDLRRLA